MRESHQNRRHDRTTISRNGDKHGFLLIKWLFHRLAPGSPHTSGRRRVRQCTISRRPWSQRLHNQQPCMTMSAWERRVSPRLTTENVSICLLKPACGPHMLTIGRTYSLFDFGDLSLSLSLSLLLLRKLQSLGHLMEGRESDFSLLAWQQCGKPSVIHHPQVITILMGGIPTIGPTLPPQFPADDQLPTQPTSQAAW